LIFDVHFVIVIIAFEKQATIAQVVERNIGNVEVTGPTPVSSFYFFVRIYAALSGFIFIHRRPDHLLSARSLSFIYSIPVRQTVLKHIHKWYISEYDKKQYRQSQEQYDRSHLTFTFFSFALRSHATTP
jgi:hypothetical protein